MFIGPGFDFMAPLAGSLCGLGVYALVPSWKGIHSFAQTQPTLHSWASKSPAVAVSKAARQDNGPIDSLCD